MKYTDKDGDVWEDTADEAQLLCVASTVAGFEGQTFLREYVERTYGPLRSADDEASDAPSDSLPRVTDVMDRAAVFQNAHALVTGLEWGEEKPSVYDVLNVAKWLEGEG